MPWTTDAPPDVAKNWTPEEIEKCVTAGNQTLADGGTDEEATFACIGAAGRERGGPGSGPQGHTTEKPGAGEGEGGGDTKGPASGNQAKQGTSPLKPDREIADEELEKAVTNFKPKTMEDEWGDPMDSVVAVRWTDRPECGTDRQSINHQTGESEMGLSVENLAPVPANWKGKEKAWIKQQVGSYSFMKGRPYVMLGWSYRNARGSDNEPLIEASTSKLLGVANWVDKDGTKRERDMENLDGETVEAERRAGVIGQLWAVVRQLWVESRGRPAHIVRPNANDHCCQVGTLGDFKPDSFRRSKRSHEGKGLAAVIGTLAKDGSTADAAIHYNSDEWEEGAAQAHCKSCGGKFELAKTKRKDRAVALRDIATQVMAQLVPVTENGMMDPNAPYLLDIYEDAGALYAIAARAGKIIKYPLTIASDTVSIGAEQSVVVQFTPRSAWHIVRQADGSRRWFAVAATAVLNRVGEIDSKALFDDLVKNLPDNPATLRFYHDPNLEFGDIDWAEREGNVLLESGTLRDGPLADAFVDAVEHERGKWGTSIKYKPTTEPEQMEAGPGVTIPVYRAGVQAELSVLPEDAAAAWFTTITPEVMRMDKRVSDALARLFGDEEKAQEFIKKVDGTNRSIADADLVTRTAPPADAAPVVAPVADATPAAPPPALTLEDVNRTLAEALGKLPAAPKPVDLKPLTDGIAALTERIGTLEKIERDREAIRSADMPKQRAADPSYRPSRDGQQAAEPTLADKASATLSRLPQGRPGVVVPPR